MNGHTLHVTKFSTDIDKFQIISENEALTKCDLRVFCFLCCRIGSQRYSKIDISQISKSLNISKSKVKESIDNLMDFEIIQKGSDEHVKKGYKMIYTI